MPSYRSPSLGEPRWRPSKRSTTPKPFMAPRAFHLYDDHTAEVATNVGTAFVDEPDDVAHFRRQFEQLTGHARHGDDARTLLADIAGSLRQAG